MAPRRRSVQHLLMQVLPSRRAVAASASARSVLAGSLLGTALIAIGLWLGYLAFSSSIVARVMDVPRPGPASVALGVIAWAVALTAPACFVIVGAARLFGAVAPLSRPRRRTVSSLAGTLSDEYVAATRIHLPDGRVIPELVVGPHGVAVFEELPPGAASRQSGGRWEVRMVGGRWVPLENPLDRAARDAERVRRWLADDDRDFIVKVYAAVIGDPERVARTPTCAVIARDQVPAFLAALPPQRSLTPSRLARIVEHVRSAV